MQKLNGETWTWQKRQPITVWLYNIHCIAELRKGAIPYILFPSKIAHTKQFVVQLGTIVKGKEEHRKVQHYPSPQNCDQVRFRPLRKWWVEVTHNRSTRGQDEPSEPQLLLKLFL